MEVSLEHKIKFPSMVHACIAWAVCLCVSVATVHAVGRGITVGGITQSDWIGLTKLSYMYGLLLFCSAVVKLLKAQHFLLKEKSFFLSDGVVTMSVFLMLIWYVGGGFIPYIGGYVIPLLPIFFISFLYFMHAGFRLLGVSGRWVLFYYFCAGAGPIAYLHLWRMMGGNDFRIILFRYILFFTVDLVFIWQVRRSLAILQKKAVMQENPMVPV